MKAERSNLKKKKKKAEKTEKKSDKCLLHFDWTSTQEKRKKNFAQKTPKKNPKKTHTRNKNEKATYRSKEN